MIDLETYLKESRRVFSLCPECHAVWRLSDLALARDAGFAPDWKDLIDEETKKLREEQHSLQGREKAIRAEALRVAQKERIPILLERTAPTFVRRGIDPRDIRTLVDPTEFIEFRGYAADQAIDSVRFLHLGPASKIHESIATAISAGEFGWKTAQVGEEGTVTLREPTERIRKKSTRNTGSSEGE